MAGDDWATGFLSRHPELLIRRAEAVSYEGGGGGDVPVPEPLLPVTV
jgi:hypothetical protein